MKKKANVSYSKIKKNKNASTLIKNFGYLSLLQIASYLFPLITLPYLAKVIGPIGFGKIAFASAVITWFTSVITWGFDFTATRDVARNRENKESVSRIFSNILWTRVFLTVCCFPILLLLILIIPSFRNNTSVLLVTFLLIPGHVMFPEWLFQALERMKFITILSLLSKFFFTIAVLLFIDTPDDYILQPLFTALGYIVSGIVALYLIVFKWGYKVYPPSIAIIFRTLKDGADVFINNFMPNLYNSLSAVLLGSFYGDVANGLLSAGTKLINMCHQFMNVLSRVFFPFLSRKIEKHNFYAILTLTISILFSFILFAFSPFLIRLLYSDEFNDAIIILRILSVTLIFMALSNVYGTNYLILKGYEKELRNITFICSIIGMLIAIPIIYKYSYWGAALTVCLTRGLLAFVITIRAFKYNKSKNDKQITTSIQ